MARVTYTNSMQDIMDDETADLPQIIEEVPSIALKRNVSITDVPDYYEPFKYNWKRRLVYRSKFSKTSKSGPSADICYICPSGKKFWSFKKLKQYLLTNPCGLRPGNFTYVARPLGLNDETKEILDYSRRLAAIASNELSTTPDSTSKPIKRKTLVKNIRKAHALQTFCGQTVNIPAPTTFQPNGNLNNKKVVKRRLEPKLKITRIKRPKLGLPYELYSVTNNLNEQSDTDKNDRKDRVKKYFRQPNSMQALIDYHKSLQSIFNKLEVADLLRVRLVCTTWRDIADKASFWNDMSIDNLRITNWNNFAHFLESHKTKYLNMKGLVDIEYINWDDAVSAIARTNVTDLELNGCSAAIAEKISQKCLRLKSLSLTLLNPDTVNLNNMDKMNQHSEDEVMQVSYESTQGINVQGDLASLLSLSNLTHLTLKTIKNLTVLKLNENLTIPSDDTQDLRYLRLERFDTRAFISFNIVDGISSLTKLEHLELIDFEIEENFDEQLKKCVNLKSLILIPAYNVATSNRIILKGILSLKENLNYVTWGIHMNHLRKSKALLWKQWQTNQRDVDFVPIIEPVPFLYLIDKSTHVLNKQERYDDESVESLVYSIKMIQLSQLRKLISSAMPNTIVNVLRIEKLWSATTPEYKEPKFCTVFV